MTHDQPDPAPDDFGRFCALVGSISGVAPARLATPGTLVGEVAGGDVGLLALVAALQDLNPFAALPEQVEAATLSVADLHHLCVTMGPDHHAPERS